MVFYKQQILRKIWAKSSSPWVLHVAGHTEENESQSIANMMCQDIHIKLLH